MKTDEVKPEPLNKKMYHNVDIVCGKIIIKRTSCAEEDDIKSAVQWLKQELSYYCEHGFSNKYLNKKIDEAFEDVIIK